jgi:methionine-S-sulfoxide reductase
MMKSVAFAMCVLVFSALSSPTKAQMSMEHPTDTITLGAGCFWCVEAIFESIPGVLAAESGYSGGHIKNPAYREVCTGRTGHAEVVQLTYDPEKVDLAMILKVFFATHDPTTLNRQGADVGTQYRSAIYIHNDNQRPIVTKAIEEAQSDWPNPIVTEVSDFDEFYPAEDYHQAYYELNQEAPYCRAVIAPKMAKFQKEFKAVIDLN